VKKFHLGEGVRSGPHGDPGFRREMGFAARLDGLKRDGRARSRGKSFNWKQKRRGLTGEK